MSRSAIQFQKSLSLPEFQRLYGSDAQCEAALDMARWPDGFRCPRCYGREHGLVYGRRLKRYQCLSCGHQATLTAGKIPIVAAVSLNEAGHPIHARITAVHGFSSEAISDWAKRNLAPGSHVLSDGLACFRAVTKANCHHKAVVTGGKHPNDLPQFLWIKTLLGNLKTSFSGTFHAFNFDK